MFRKIYDWMGSRVYSTYAHSILFWLFFLEAICFLIPTDPMLIFYCLERPKRSFLYAAIATAGSVCGGIAGYYIGYYLWTYAGQEIIHNRWLTIILKPEHFYYLCNLYQQNEHLAVLIAGFTPVPYKAATLTAGFCHLALPPFIICSIIARGARFFIYACCIRIWGARIKEYIDRYFNLFVCLIGTLIILFIWLLKR